MGSQKLLLPVEGEPLVRRSIGGLLAGASTRWWSCWAGRPTRWGTRWPACSSVPRQPALRRGAGHLAPGGSGARLPGGRGRGGGPGRPAAGGSGHHRPPGRGFRRTGAAITVPRYRIGGATRSCSPPGSSPSWPPSRATREGGAWWPGTRPGSTRCWSTPRCPRMSTPGRSTRRCAAATRLKTREAPGRATALDPVDRWLQWPPVPGDDRGGPGAQEQADPYLRRTKQGEEVVVTERGRPIAVIQPIQSAQGPAAWRRDWPGRSPGAPEPADRTPARRPPPPSGRGVPVSRTILADRR